MTTSKVFSNFPSSPPIAFDLKLICFTSVVEDPPPVLDNQTAIDKYNMKYELVHTGAMTYLGSDKHKTPGILCLLEIMKTRSAVGYKTLETLTNEIQTAYGKTLVEIYNQIHGIKKEADDSEPLQKKPKSEKPDDVGAGDTKPSEKPQVSIFHHLHRFKNQMSHFFEGFLHL